MRAASDVLFERFHRSTVALTRDSAELKQNTRAMHPMPFT